jgi:predicted nucleotidyltransferase
LLNIKKNIIATLTYFDMFDYPLTYHEIFLFLECKCNENDLREAINYLIGCKLIFKLDEFYSLKNDIFISIRRQKGNQKAAELLNKAKYVGQLLIKFPYVRGVGISGSLSKNFADDQSDIDLFIIVRRNRIWIARTMMHIFKKFTFLVNKQHHYCMNYYVDEQQLEIVEKNIYTAIEITTLIPLQGDSAFTDFYFANAWTKDFLPNKVMRIASAKPLKGNILKFAIETIFNNSFGSWVDGVLMKITAQRWNRKTHQKKLNARGTIMGMCASKHFAKPDPKNFQLKLIESYQNKLSPLLNQTEVLAIR